MLYVADTDKIMKYRYEPGELRITDPGSELADLPSTVNHHWTKAMVPLRGSASTSAFRLITESSSFNGVGSEPALPGRPALD